ncbi:QRFP-like peptide receptor [Ptychodera flava]|uniref:QRFP-like peptide receptor n=1 Tax=Ptychodera flava TaxID=63121 RepID=UPI00396A2C0A
MKETGMAECKLYQEIMDYIELHNIRLNGTNWTEYLDYDPCREEPNYPDMSMSFKSQVFLTLVFTCNMVLSIIGNVIVIIVLMCQRSGLTDLNAFLIHLAVADLTIAIFCMPFTFPTIMYGHWIFGNAMCSIVIFVQQIAVIVSVLTLTAVGVDRYFAVFYPLKVRVTKNRAKIVFILIWLLAGSLATTQTVFLRVEKRHYDGEIIFFCSEWFPNSIFARCFELIILLVTYVIPLGVLCCTYSAVGLRLWGRTIPGNADQIRDQEQARAKKKMIKMLVIIVLLFALFWLPLHIFKLVNTFHPKLYGDLRYQDTMRTINCFVLWLATAHSFVNPLVYSILNDNFRSDLHALARRCYIPVRRKRKATFSLRNRRLDSRSSLSTTRKLSLSSTSFFGRNKRLSEKSVSMKVQEDMLSK